MMRLLSWCYGVAVRIRQVLFQWGFLQARELRRPVISVGNLTVGGTGKSPFVAYLAGVLKQLGYQPIILSRGYRGTLEKTGGIVSEGSKPLLTPEEAGDEPYMLAAALTDVAVVVGRDRYRAGRSIEDRYDRAIHLLDDGFQHLWLKRNLNLLLIDATDPFGGGHLLPRGRLREPLAGIRRADMVIVTRSHLLTAAESIETTIRRHHPTVPIAYFYHDAVGLRDLRTGNMRRLRDLVNRPVVVLAAIANPAVLLSDLAHYQIRVLDQVLFRDHHAFKQDELDQALHRAREAGADCVITTEKDAVRLRHLDFGEGDVLAFQIEARPEDREEFLKIWQEEVEGLLQAR